MQYIVINACHGGFGLSCKAMMLYAKLKGIKLYFKKDYNGLIHYSTKPIKDVCRIENDDYFNDCDIKRDDSILVRVVGELGEEANDSCASLKVVAIPDNIEWTIEEYDGWEWVAEKHRTWD